MASSAAAQSSPAAASGSRWSIEAYGGVSFGRWTGGGQQTLPAAGAPIATSSPVFPSWSVPTWFMGDGAAFLNNVAAEFGLINRITPFDSVLTHRGLGGPGQFLSGARLTRRLDGPWSVEIGIELGAQPAGFSSDFLASLSEAASSFESTFRELLATGPFTAPVVSAGRTATAGSSRDASLTVALRTSMSQVGGFDTYAVAGGGLVLAIGDGTTAGVEGRYRFQIGGAVPIDETDRATVSFRGWTTYLFLFGGGVERAIGPRSGVRLDARVLAGPATTGVDVSTVPTAVTATPAGFIESFTYPNLQFSNNASTGRRSTLGAPGLDGVSVWSGGWSVRARATFGVFLRF